MSEAVKPHSIKSFESMISFLSKYNGSLGPKPMLPAEIVPFHYRLEEAINIFDNSIEKTPNFFGPDDIEKKLQIVEHNTKSETIETIATHFGKPYKADTTTYYSNQNNIPEGRKIVYKRSFAQKLLKVGLWPEYTLELIGYDKGANHRVSIGVTSYRNRKGKQMLIYSYFEENIGATITIGSPKLSDNFKKRLIEVFKLDQ
jgi:hypothetical protein